MKKSLIALAALAASGVAMAQSSVTLYGVLDTGLTYSKGAESVYGLTHVGGNTNSRLGFRGTEDLGNGLKAIFNLEAGMGVDDGTDYFTGSGMAFRRTSFVGLEGSFGTVRMGRMLTSSYLSVGRYDAFNDTGIGGSLAWNGPQTGYAPRTQNAVSYTSPVFSGFKLGADYGFGEQKRAGDNRYFGLGATYDNGPLSLGAGYDRLNGNTAASTTTAEDQITWQLGGAYNFGVAKLMAFYKHSKYQAAGLNAALFPDVKFKTFGLGVSAPVGAAGEVRASFNNYKMSDNLGKANQLSLGYVHNLSKRTALYSTYSYIKNKDGLTFQLSGAMAGAGLKDGEKQHGLQLGVRHAF